MESAILARLDKVKGPDKNGEHLALCPFHDDKNPSLSINFEKGVYYCQGCQSSGPVSRLAQRLGVDCDFVTTKKEEAATYDYVDAEGQLLFQAVRYNPKDFRQRRPDGAGGWVYDLKGVKRMLYRLPEVLEAIGKGETVYIVEGEKDADALRGLGLVATTNPMGAGKWRPEYSDSLQGANVVILPDKDEPGRKHAQQVAQSLKAAWVKVVEVPAGKDPSDWLQAGGTKAELERLVSEAKPLEARPRSGFNLTKLSDLLAEPPEDIAFVWADTLSRGGLSLLVAKPKVGKSTFARNLALKIARGDAEFLGRAITTPGPDVLFLLEEKRSEVRKHFEKMGADALPILVHIGSAPEAALAELHKVIVDHGAVFAVVDPLQRLVRISNLNDYSEVSLALEPLEQIARTTGCHIMLVHHANKGIGREGGDSILGSTALFGGVDCALIMKRTEAHRTIESIQRYGEDLPRTVLAFDTVTGLTTSGGSLESYELAECGKEILGFLANREPTPEADIKENIPTPHGRGLLSKALRTLREQGKVQRSGSGKRGDPYLYSLAVEASGVSGLSGLLHIEKPTKPTIPAERGPDKNQARISGLSDSGEYGQTHEKEKPTISPLAEPRKAVAEVEL